MGIKYNKIEGKYAEKLDILFGIKDCLIEVNPGKVLIPPKYQEFGERILNMTVRSDDIWLVAYPRTGSTWSQEMVWLIQNNLNFEEAIKTPAMYRNPLLELTALVANDKGDWKNVIGNSVDTVENMKSPRCVKSHLPWELLPKQLSTVKPKILYVARNPKDVCVSYYHYCRLLHDFTGNFDDFCELFMADKAPIGPLMNHMKGFWERRDEPNILFLKYEDMKKDHRGTIIETANFLGKNITPEEISKLMDHLSFNKMRQNTAINLEPLLQIRNGLNGISNNEESKFIRKGQVGDWKNYMTEEISTKFDKWMEENLKGTGLYFEINENEK